MVDIEYFALYNRHQYDSLSRTPQSAVSSFNFPIHADPSLITPVSPIDLSAPLSSRLQLRSATQSQTNLQTPSPRAQMYTAPEDRMTIKAERHENSPDMTSFAGYFEDSPNQPAPPTPYFGSYGVSMPSTSRHSPTPSITASNYGQSYDQTHQGLVQSSPGQVHNTPLLISSEPAGLRPIKRRRSIEFQKQNQQTTHVHSLILPDSHQNQGIRRRPKTGGRARSSHPIKIKPDAEMTPQEQALLNWKETEKLPWKNIKENYETTFGNPVQETALQMKYMRLKHRLREWSDDDINALTKAIEFWEKSKWKIIAEKMGDYNVSPPFHPKWVMLKAKELFGDRVAMVDNEMSESSMSPPMTDTHSPPMSSRPRPNQSTLPNHSSPSLHLPDYRDPSSSYAVRQPENLYARPYGTHSPPLPSQLTPHYQQLRPATGNQHRGPGMGILGQDSVQLPERQSAAMPVTTHDTSLGITKTSPSMAVTTQASSEAARQQMQQSMQGMHSQPSLLYDQRPTENAWGMSGP